MDKEYVGYALAILGIALIVIGALNVAGYISFQVVDTTPPTIFYTYPVNGMTYKTSDLSEIIVYAKDDSSVVSASYNDKYGLKALAITPYTQLKHPYVIQGWKYPDVNFDGKVTETDPNLISSYIGQSYNATYDLNSDGVVNINDVSFAGKYVNSATFAVSITPSYSTGENVTFVFSVLDSAGNTATMTGSFNTMEYTLLSGTWKINDKIVSNGMNIELSERTTTVTFICNDTTVSASDATAKVIIGTTTKILPYTGSLTWQNTIEFPPGTSPVILEASTSSSMNKIAVSVSTPELFTFTVGHALMLSGGISLIAGVVIILKKREVEW